MARLNITVEYSVFCSNCGYRDAITDMKKPITIFKKWGWVQNKKGTFCKSCNESGSNEGWHRVTPIRLSK